MGTYLFSTSIATDSRWVITGMIGAAVLMVIGIVVPVVLVRLQRKQGSSQWFPLIRSFARIARTAGLVWLVLFFLRYEVIAPFVARIWVYAVLIGAIAWGMWEVRAFRRRLPEYARSQVLQDRYHRYLPKQGGRTVRK